MKIVPLKPALESVFWKQVNQDIPHYHFFAFDWKYNREDTEILLALERDRIEGMMLVYKHNIVQFRGSCEAVNALLKMLDLESVELQALKKHKRYVLEKYEPTSSHELILMTMNREERKLDPRHPVTELEVSDAEDIAAIMRVADPEFWGTMTREQIVDGIGQVNWFGLKVDGELVSISKTRSTDWAGHVGVVATHEAHRNRGYATSVVSHSVKKIFEEHSLAMIYVLSDNFPAVRVYERVGFKPYRTYFFMRGKKR